jgi:hypothetical protein
LSVKRGVEPMRCLAGLQCCRSRLRRDCSQSRSPGQVAAQLGLRPQTCSPSPCLQQGANLTLPVRLRRQQGAQSGTASALVTPLVACRNPAAAACSDPSLGRSKSWRASTQPPHARRGRCTPPAGRKKGWGGIWPGALLVLRSAKPDWYPKGQARCLSCRRTASLRA